MNNLISEQLPSDGSFQLHNILERANIRLSKLGKHGKRCKLKNTGNKVVLQFNFGGQVQRSPNCNFTKDGIAEAEAIAAMVTNRLVTGQYSDDWLNNDLLGKKPNKSQKVSTGSEFLTEYKEFWFKENKKLKAPNGCWLRRFRYIEQVFATLHKPISEQDIHQVIAKTNNNSATRAYTLQALSLFCSFFSLDKFDRIINQYKLKNKPQKKNKYVPSDEEIMSVYNQGFIPHSNCPKNRIYRYAQWQFLYGLLATYGLRIHEAWNIANWDKPVILKDGDWIEIGLENELGEEKTFIEKYQKKKGIIPAITDPDNNTFILAIRHDTKTGYRIAMPLSPNGYDWLKEFKLIDKFNLPDIDNPLKKQGKEQSGTVCTNCTCQWFKRRKYGFTAHALRHAYNHRAHEQQLNPTAIAKSLGHSLLMNQGTYWQSMNINREIQMIESEIYKAQNEKSMIEKLKEENKYLKAENERLKTELKMYETLKGKL